MRHASPGFGVRYRALHVPLCLAAAIVAFSLPSFAQPATSTDRALTCVLRDITGHPLPGIAIELHSVSPPLEMIRALTEADGSYHFGGLHEGEYTIVAAGGLLSPPEHVQVHYPQATLSLRLPIELPLIPGRSADLVSVQQLRPPNKAQQTFAKATEAWTRNDTHQSRALALQALDQQADYAPALTLLGMIDLQEGHPDEAIANLLQSLKQSPSSPRTYLVLASAYNQQHRNMEALDALSIASKFVAGSWQLHYETGRAYLGQARFQNAATQFDRAQQASTEDNMIVRLGKAHALLGLQDYQGARQELAAILEKSPHGPYSDESRKLAGLIDAQPKKPAIPAAAHPVDTHAVAAASVRIEH
jgi:tetratricopeptide (TPR) repeat protein